MKMYVINAILTLTLNVTLTLTLISLTQTQLLTCTKNWQMLASMEGRSGRTRVDCDA